jgi:hypothetical protein
MFKIYEKADKKVEVTLALRPDTPGSRDKSGGVKIVAVNAKTGLSIPGGNIITITKDGYLQRHKGISVPVAKAFKLTPSGRINLDKNDPLDDR